MTATPPGAGPTPLLGTKLHPPRRRRALVARPRLTEIAARSRHRSLTLVSAPAGFGKTTLVADWFAGAEATAWLSLDPRDDDPERFWTYVVAALGVAVPELGDETTTLLQVPGTPLEVIVATLINDLETTAPDLVLVLDDYHVIHRVDIHESLAFLLEHLPSQVRLVIATRADPPLPLATMRARGELLEVRAADLRFTAEESAEYLNGAMALTLDDADIGMLEARTEGWIAALQLAALSLQGRADPAAFVAEFAGDDRFILDYLADEVLERQRPEVRDFLLETSILSRLSAPVCAAVTGLDDARSMLDELDRSNLFLIALDDRRSWYRYHHLFGDVLRARLEGEHADRIPGLHRRASDWYAADGDPQEAIDHALAAGDPSRAAELIELAAPGLNDARQEARLRTWLEALPPDLFEDRPALTILLVGARMSTGDASGIEPLLELAEAWTDSDATPIVFDHDEFARLPTVIAIYRAGLALLAGDIDGTVAHATRVLDLVGDTDPFQRGAAAALVGLAHWNRGNLETAGDRYQESIACFERVGRFADVLGCSLTLADIQITEGRLGDAQRTFESALRLAEQHPGLRGAADMHVGLCCLAVEHDDLELAAQHLQISADLGEHLGLPQHPYRQRVAAARLHRALGDLESALDLLEAAEPRYNTDYSPSVRPVAAIKAGVQIEMGDLAAADRWAASTGITADDDPVYVHEFEHLTFARLLVARGSSDELQQAIDLLTRLLAAADDGRRAGSALEIAVALAVAQQVAGDEAEATAQMERALARGSGERYARTFLDAGPVAIEILGSLQGPAATRAGQLLASGAPAEVRVRSRPAGPDELSERELDVLRLLRSDLTGPDIARELHVSLNTLRTHTKHIYTKLGATNRREAVSRAAQLGI